MEYRNRIQRTIDYIEDRARADIRMEQLADVACFSPFHFCRMFQVFTGSSVMEYVRHRRLASSIFDLKHGGRLVDIAIEYGFGSRDSYSRAFKRVYGMTPGECRKQRKFPVPEKRLVLEEREQNSRSKVMVYGLKMKIMEMPEITVAGYELKTDLSRNTQDIPKFWQKLIKDGSLETTPGKLHISAEYGQVQLAYCTETGSDGNSFSYIIGWIVDDARDLPDGLKVYQNPALTYAVFTTPPTPVEHFSTVIQLTSRYVFHDWLPSSEYEFDERGSDLEWYDQRGTGTDNVCMDVCVPIKSPVKGQK